MRKRIRLTVFLLPLIVALLVLLCARKRLTHGFTFRRTQRYWTHHTSVNVVAADDLAKLMVPMMSEEGIAFLIERMEEGDDQQSQAAVMALLPICETLYAAGTSNADAMKLLGPIEDSSFFVKARILAKESDNPAIRDMLRVFLQSTSVREPDEHSPRNVAP